MKKSLVLLGVVIFLTIVLSFNVPFKSNNISFNQRFQEELFRSFKSYSKSDFLLFGLSNYSARLNNFFNGSFSEELDLSNPKNVFDYVWKKLPYYAIVYPTERYYYFSIPSISLAGNLRFADIETGLLSFAYFNTEDTLQFQYTVLSQKDGLDVKMISEKLVKLSYAGKTVFFHLPSQDTNLPNSFSLLPDEEFVANIQDESAIRFFLIFNDTTKSFYYVVNEDYPITETLTDLGEHLLLGDRTKFIYWNDEDTRRKILIGVDAYSIMANNYFDGPFDQVPPHLPLRDKLYKAYPYTQYLRGLDEHGNFLDFEGQRVAISPYTDYYGNDFPEVKEMIESCINKKGPVLWACLTYESKRDFHKTIPEFFYPDGSKK